MKRFYGAANRTHQFYSPDTTCFWFHLVSYGAVLPFSGKQVSCLRGSVELVEVLHLYSLYSGAYHSSFLVSTFIFGRFVYKYWRKKNTYYALTNRRALILTRGLFGSFQSTYISNSQNIGLSMGARGTGSITFGNVPFWGAAYGNSGMGIFGGGFGSSVTAFYDIENAKRVYEMINEVRDNS